MKFKPITPLVMGLAVALSTPAPASQLPDAGQKFESLASAMRGASASTRRRVLEDFRRDLEGTIVRFTGTVWTLSSLDLDLDRGEGPDVRPALFLWEYEGIQVKGGQPSSVPPGEIPSQKAKIRLGGADHATLIIVRSGKYQLYALTAAPAIIDRLRQGAAITVEAQITGLLEDSLFGFVTTILDAAAVPRCPNGDELPADHDFNFCPYCGESLK